MIRPLFLFSLSFAFALAGTLWLALAAIWLVVWVRRAMDPLTLAWINRGLDTNSRATVPSHSGPHYHHIGIYAFRRQALETFVKLPRGRLEKQEKLEQLRALEAGMRIDVAAVDTVPLGVDAPEDLARARALLGRA